jgi:uncharacterized protein YhfF/uncharacterized protein YciI
MPFFLYLLHPPRATFAHDATEAEQAVMGEHFAHLLQGVRDGIVLLAGPRIEPTPLGVTIIEAASLAEAEAFATADPAVRAGVQRAEVGPMRLSLLRGRDVGFAEDGPGGRRINLIDGMPAWGFAFPGALRDRLTALVLAGEKRATAGLLADYVADGDALPRPGVRNVILDSQERPVCIVETTRVEIVRCADVGDEFARAEGEGFAGHTDWRAAHERFWAGYIDDLRAALGDPGFEVGDDTLVVCEWFRLVDAP